MKILSKQYTKAQRSFFDISQSLSKSQEGYELLTVSSYEGASRIKDLLNQQDSDHREFLAKPGNDPNFWTTPCTSHSATELEEERLMGWEEHGVLIERLKGCEDEERKLKSALKAVR